MNTLTQARIRILGPDTEERMPYGLAVPDVDETAAS
jgi:hypothetical protein